MQISFSRVEKFKQCPFAYKLRYINGVKTPFNCDAKNALVHGSAVHIGLEKGIDAAEKYFIDAFPVVTDDIYSELIAINSQIKKAQKICPTGDFEVKLEHENFIGYIDLVEKNEDGTVNIYDFKFSNNEKTYRNSAQLHLYKVMFENIFNIEVKNLRYLMIPKPKVKRPFEESTEIYRKRMRKELESKTKTPYFIGVPFDYGKVISWFLSAVKMQQATEHQKNKSFLCNWCEFKQFCEKGTDYMLLPKNERREKEVILRPNMWVYGDSYVGKSTFIDSFDDVLFLNTDGNTENITSPVLPVANEIKIEGRLKKETLAWEVFKGYINALETEKNDYKTVALDLFEDLYEHCRVYMYKKLDIEHEQDAGFGKGWDMVKTEFFSTIKRLNHLGYQVIFISKEIQNEVSLRNGSKFTTYKPNVQDKVAQVITGVVGMTIRAFLTNDGEHLLQLQKKENIFGGGRFDFKKATCQLEKDAFLKELTDAQNDAVSKKPTRASRNGENAKVQEEGKKISEETEQEQLAENPTPRTRKPKSQGKPMTQEIITTTQDDEEEQKEEAPARTRTRRKCGE